MCRCLLVGPGDEKGARGQAPWEGVRGSGRWSGLLKTTGSPWGCGLLSFSLPQQIRSGSCPACGLAETKGLACSSGQGGHRTRPGGTARHVQSLGLKSCCLVRRPGIPFEEAKSTGVHHRTAARKGARLQGPRREGSSVVARSLGPPCPGSGYWRVCVCVPVCVCAYACVHSFTHKHQAGALSSPLPQRFCCVFQ